MRQLTAFMGGYVLLLSVGCAGDKLDLHEVTGTVKFKDGTVPQGEMSSITFTPVVVMERKGAFSEIEADGSFELYTLTQGDGGALAGDYRVTLNVIKGYPQRRSLVARKYTSLDETPLEATVKAGEQNHFDFEVEKR